MSQVSEWPQYTEDIQYSEDSPLNTYETCLPRPADDNTDRYWFVYIHGGAWRDPEIDASSYRKIRDVLLASSVSDQIAGYASINYRLSSYPSHPTNPSNPSDPARNAVHPDHVNDVLAAILHLQETYHFRDRYILSGHSCGTTLAFQVAMKRYWGSQYESTFALELNVEPPIAIVGLHGIYDIPALLSDFYPEPEYEDFIKAAFGSADREAISPAYGPPYHDYGESWSDGKVAVLAHSSEDELVNWKQTSMQADALRKSGFDDTGAKRVHVCTLTGGHDEVWKNGEAAKAIVLAVQELDKIRLDQSTASS